MKPTRQEISKVLKSLKHMMMGRPETFWDVVSEQYECTVTFGLTTDGLVLYTIGMNNDVEECRIKTSVILTNYSNCQKLAKMVRDGLKARQVRLANEPN